MNIIESIHDRALLGANPCFADLRTWKAQLVLLSAIYGLDLDPEGVALFKKHTGRSRYAPPPGGWPIVEFLVGRQSGKTEISAAFVTYAAVSAPLVRGGQRYALLVAQNQRGACRNAFARVKAYFDASPTLRRMIVAETQDSLTLSNNIVIAAYPCNPDGVRGLIVTGAGVDEWEFFRNSEGYDTSAEMLRAVLATVAMTGGKIFISTSPGGQVGHKWEFYRKHYAKDDSSVLIWQASAPEMNPLLSADYLARMREVDASGYRSEVMGEHAAGLSNLFDPEALDRCIARDRRELLPAAELSYSAFVDPSGGSRDAFTLSIGHRADERVVVDLARAWHPPFNPSSVTSEMADLLKTYRVASVQGDRYGGEFPRELFRRHGIDYVLADLDRSALYLELLSNVNAAAIELPDDAQLLRELRELERRRGPSGRDRVDHRPGAHDDLANAVAGVCHLLAGPALEPPMLWGGPSPIADGRPLTIQEMNKHFFGD